MNSVLRGFLILVGLVASLAVTLAIFGLDVPVALGHILEGAAGDKFGITRTFVRSTPLLLCGLGVIVAWQAGMFNIGGEGQFIIGGLSGALLAKFAFSLSPQVLSPLILIASVIGGALYSALAGWLYTKRGVNVVISTILLNFIALQILDWSVSGPLQERKDQIFKTDDLPERAMLMRFDSATDFHFGVILAFVAALLTGIWLYRTKGGFLTRFVGSNEKVVTAHGLSSQSIQMKAMVISGGLCGLAGGIEYAGLIGWIGQGFSQNFGFMAIPVALLGSLNPYLTMLSSLWFGALYAGTEELKAQVSIGNTLVPFLQAIAVLGFIVFQQLRLKREQEATA